MRVLRRSSWGREAGSWWTLAALALSSFLLLLGDTSLSVTLPAIGRDVGLGLGGLEWLVNSYTLALAVLLLPAGKLTDRLGARPVFLVGLAVFVLFSLVAAVASGPVLLMAARVLQGAGAAAATPAALAVITATFPPQRRGVALGIWAGAATSALAVGPLAGALLAESFGWRAIFLANIPLGLLAMVAAARFVPRSVGVVEAVGFDISGLATSAIGLGALLYALTNANTWGWTSIRFLALLVVAAGALAAFIAVERRSRSPLLELHLFRSRSFSGANGVGLLITAVMCSLLFFMSLYLQLGLGYSPLRTGLVFLPLTALVGLVAPLAGRIADRRGPRVPMVSGMVVFAVALFILAALSRVPSLGGLLAALGLAGFGMGLANTPMTVAALSGVTDERAGAGSAVLNVFRMIGLTLGIASMGAVLAASNRAAPGGFSGALSLALLVDAGIALAGALLALTTIESTREKPAPAS